MTYEPKQDSDSSAKFDRRKFLGLAAGGAGVMFIKPQLVFGTDANSAIRVGLLGCRGRGTEDASNLVDAGGARGVALAELFRDQLDAARPHFAQLQQAKGVPAADCSKLLRGPQAADELGGSPCVESI